MRVGESQEKILVATSCSYLLGPLRVEETDENGGHCCTVTNHVVSLYDSFDRSEFGNEYIISTIPKKRVHAGSDE